MPIYRLSSHLEFPPPDAAEDGLLAVGGDLQPERLLLAYQEGIFPWYDEDNPILWWSPDPRFVLYPDAFHLPKRTRRHIRSAGYTISMDTAFPDVIQACAEIPRHGENGTWITPEMEAAYTTLFDMGYAHSIECRQDGELVGGLYGVSIGACFSGESMFSWRNNASKAALAALIDFARRHQFHFIDCQMHTEHLEHLGARDINRSQFLAELAIALRHETVHGPWKSEL